LRVILQQKAGCEMARGKPTARNTGEVGARQDRKGERRGNRGAGPLVGTKRKEPEKNCAKRKRGPEGDELQINGGTRGS